MADGGGWQVVAPGRPGGGWPEPHPDSSPWPHEDPPPEARKRPPMSGWDVVLLVDLILIGLFMGLALVAFLAMASGLLPETDPGSIAFQRAAIWAQMGINLVAFGIVPFAWVVGTRVGGWEGAKRFLGLHDPGMSVLWGVLIAGGLLLLLLPVAYLADQFLPLPDEGAGIDPALLTWPLVITISIVAGFAEEILFRGVLQKWLGWWGQGLLFGVFHLPNGGTFVGAGFVFLITGGIGVLLGYLRHRGASMWALITAHLVYDLVLLGTVMLFPELA